MGTISDKVLVCSSLKEALISVYGKDVSVEKKQAVHGGDANDAYKLYLSNEEALFLKINSISNEDFFRVEAEGVAAIRKTKTIRVPHIHAIGTDDGYSFLLMEFIERAVPKKDFWEKLGTGLADMHKADTSSFLYHRNSVSQPLDFDHPENEPYHRQTDALSSHTISSYLNYIHEHDRYKAAMERGEKNFRFSSKKYARHEAKAQRRQAHRRVDQLFMLLEKRDSNLLRLSIC